MSTTKQPPVARVLPLAAARALQRAAQTPNTPDDPQARAKAIDKATARIKREYPQHFKED